MSDNAPAASQQKPGGAMIVLLIVSWLWVGVPLAWGVSKTVENSLKLFQTPEAAAPAAPAAPK